MKQEKKCKYCGVKGNMFIFRIDFNYVIICCKKCAEMKKIEW